MKTVVCLFCLVVLVAGCTVVRETALDISKEEVLNAQTAREVAINYLSIWSLQSGFIKGALGPRINEMPAHAIEAMNELDQLAEQQASGNPNNYSDEDLGRSLGLRVRVLLSIIGEALKLFAPDILEAMPLIF